mmetsp:Transcript_7130/g.12348  ORF Transcript_7130/g.12348 Transcript_7130/m.12348 type:complete len:220 (+) Transcript_7130:765-1424(+)
MSSCRRFFSSSISLRAFLAAMRRLRSASLLSLRRCRSSSSCILSSFFFWRSTRLASFLASSMSASRSSSAILSSSMTSSSSSTFFSSSSSMSRCCSVSTPSASASRLSISALRTFSTSIRCFFSSAFFSSAASTWKTLEGFLRVEVRRSRLDCCLDLGFSTPPVDADTEASRLESMSVISVSSVLLAIIEDATDICSEVAADIGLDLPGDLSLEGGRAP